MDEEPTLRKFKEDILLKFADVVDEESDTVSHRCGAFKIETDPWGVHLSHTAAKLLVRAIQQKTGR